MNEQPRKALTVEEAAGRLGVNASLVYHLVAGRRLRASRIGHGRGRIRITEAAIDEYLKATEIPAPPKTPPPRRRPSASPWDAPLTL